MKTKYDDHLLRELGFEPEESGDERVLRYEEGDKDVRFAITINMNMGAATMTVDAYGSPAYMPMPFEEIRAVAALLDSMEETA